MKMLMLNLITVMLLHVVTGQSGSSSSLPLFPVTFEAAVGNAPLCQQIGQGGHPCPCIMKNDLTQIKLPLLSGSILVEVEPKFDIFQCDHTNCTKYCGSSETFPSESECVQEFTTITRTIKIQENQKEAVTTMYPELKCKCFTLPDVDHCTFTAQLKVPTACPCQPIEGPIVIT